MKSNSTEIALGIVIDGDKALLIERRQREIGRSGSPIIWAFPGGKIEGDETPKDAAAREVLEETGYVVEPVETITEGEHIEYPVYVHYIGCRVVGRTELDRLPDEIVDMQWASLDSLEEIFIAPVNEHVRSYVLRATN